MRVARLHRHTDGMAIYHNTIDLIAYYKCIIYMEIRERRAAKGFCTGRLRITVRREFYRTITEQMPC